MSEENNKIAREAAEKQQLGFQIAYGITPHLPDLIADFLDAINKAQESLIALLKQVAEEHAQFGWGFDDVHDAVLNALKSAGVELDRVIEESPNTYKAQGADTKRLEAACIKMPDPSGAAVPETAFSFEDHVSMMDAKHPGWRNIPTGLATAKEFWEAALSAVELWNIHERDKKS